MNRREEIAGKCAITDSVDEKGSLHKAQQCERSRIPLENRHFRQLSRFAQSADTTLCRGNLKYVFQQFAAALGFRHQL